MVHAFGVTWILAMVVDKAMGMQISPDAERSGIDVDQHTESAYDFVGSSAGMFAGVGHNVNSPGMNPPGFGPDPTLRGEMWRARIGRR